MEIAHARQVELSADNGTNFNHVSDEVLAGLVRFQFRRLNCSIDGVTQEVYQHYRRRGVLSQVLGNIKKLNVTGSYFHHAKVGHLLKTRAKENHGPRKDRT